MIEAEPDQVLTELPSTDGEVVVFYANGIGDTILTLPTLRALSRIFSGRMTLICESTHARLCLSELATVQLAAVDMWRSKGGFREFDAKRAVSRVRKCDAFISVVNWSSSSVKACISLLNPRITVGLTNSFAIRVRASHEEHAVDMPFHIPRRLHPGLTIDDFSSRPRFGLPAERVVECLRMLKPDTRFLAVHAETSADKMWPPARFIEVLNSFLDRHGDYVAIVVGEKAQPVDLGPHRDRILSFSGLPLPVSCAIVADADLFLGIDSCMLHVADLSRVPGVGLFGPTSSQRWGFRFAPHRHVCGQQMTDLSPSRVIEALEECHTLYAARSGQVSEALERAQLNGRTV